MQKNILRHVFILQLKIKYFKLRKSPHSSYMKRLSMTGPLKRSDSFSLAISYNFRRAFGTLMCWKIIFMYVISTHPYARYPQVFVE